MYSNNWSLTNPIQDEHVLETGNKETVNVWNTKRVVDKKFVLGFCWLFLDGGWGDGRKGF
jgi:hypothetical protein